MTSPTIEKIRLTITVTPEVHETFLRMSKAIGFSLGRTMGEWLGDTQEAAEAMTQIVEKAKEGPKQAMRQMHSYVLGLSDTTTDLLDRLAEKEREQPQSPLARDAAAEVVSAPSPRPVIRGGKSTVEKPAPRVKKAVSPMKFPLPPAKVQAYADTNGKPPKASK